MTGHTKLVRRALAAFGVAALGLAGFASAASALPGPDQPGHPTVGSLTVNKYKGQPTATPSPTNLLNGVEFIVTPVGKIVNGTCTAINTSMSPDWTGLETLFNSAPTAPAAPYCLLPAQAVTQATVNGQTTFANLPLGVYYVQEGADLGNNNIVSKVPSFYVSVPMPANGDWTYDVVANPKNAVVNKPTKTITGTPSGLVQGSNVTWNLTVPVPTLNNNEKFNQAVITDVLNANLSHVSSTLTLNGAPLSVGTDYTLDPAGVTWTFTPAGRLKLDAAPGGIIAVELVTKVTTVPADGTIPNSNYSSTFNGTTVPGTDVPYTYWGQLAIKKVDNSTPAKPLAGAEFQVFEASGACPATAPATGQISTGTSGADGVVAWNNSTPTNASPLGLWVANSPNGPLAAPSKNYCVYETKVPAGYSAQPFTNPVTITPGQLANGAFSLTVVNPQKQGPALPLTGSGGTLVLTVGGLVLIGAGVGTVVATRKRRSHEA